MAIIKRFAPNNIYISKRIREKLGTIYKYRATLVEAPLGYGKTTAVRTFLEEEKKPYIWFSIDKTDKEKMYKDFCEKVKTLNKEVGEELELTGCPNDVDTCARIVNSLSRIKYEEETVFVVDNYHRVADVFFDEIIKALSGVSGKNLRIVIITRSIAESGAIEMIMNNNLGYIKKTDFELNESEIKQYYKLCGIKLEDEEALFLKDYTEGYISALYLLMTGYEETGRFEITTEIEKLIGKAVWDNLNRREQDFLIEMAVFDSFTLRQCIYVSDERLEEKCVENLIRQNGFIRYDAKKGKYQMHAILRHFLENEFDKLEVIFKKDILKSAGDWYRDNEEYEKAIVFYYRINDVESILKMDYSAQILYNLGMDMQKRKILIDITTNISVDLKRKYLRTYILFIHFLFIYNEREYFERECELAKALIENSYKNSEEYREYLGEYFVLEAYKSFNKLHIMKDNMKTAYDKLKKSSRILGSGASFLLECPSPAVLFHSNEGKMDKEADDLDEVMPYFYRLTDGRSKGVEALFRAEMLLCRGELTDSLKLCEKAIYMCTTRNQTDVHIAALLCICKIAYLTGDSKRLKDAIAEMNAIADENSGNIRGISNFRDMCLSFISVTVDNADNVSAWLKDSGSIEKNTLITGLPFANIIYGRYLILTEQYSSFLSISGQTLKIADINNSIIARIYMLIYMAIAKNQTGIRDKAKDILTEAIELAKPDGIYIPFVENYGIIGSILAELETGVYDNEFIKTVNRYAKKYLKGLESAHRATGEEKRYGLTKRELEVAKLAAMRLSNKEIADKLFIAESTVKSNLKIVFNKLGINSRSDLSKYIP